MPRPRPPYLRYDASRKFPWYVQKPGSKKHRIREQYGTDAFDDAYRAAIDAIAQAKAAAPKITAEGGSLEWGWLLYRVESAEWKRLSSATRRQRENIMRHVIANGGAAKIGAVDRGSIVAAIDAQSATPFQAKNFLQTMRGLFGWFVATGKIKADPTTGVKVRKPRTRGFLEWDMADILRFEERWPIGNRERVMLDVYCYTGLRRGDAARVGPGHVHKGTITLATEKSQGQTIVHLPLLDVLKRTIEAGPTGKRSFICTAAGNPFKKESLGNVFKDACIAAGILNKSAHGLRKAAATRAADNGATAHELMAIFGWVDIKEAEIYTRAADRKRLAARAMEKLGT